MGALHNEPSMEDILSSIKRIISDGSDRPQPPRGSRTRAVEPDAPPATGEIGQAPDGQAEAEPVLELTQRMPEAVAAPPVDGEKEAVMAERAPDIMASSEATGCEQTRDETVRNEAARDEAARDEAASPGILSDRSAQAARESLSHLSALLVRPEEGESNTLEGLVREMLRPMLKDWMEAHLPELVESMVKREIDRIVGRLG